MDKKLKFILFFAFISLILISNLSSSQSTVPELLFSNVSQISSSNFSASSPSIATDSIGNIHIVWDQGFPLYYGKIFYTKLDRFGNTIVSNRQLSNFSGIHGFASSIVVDKFDNLHIAWAYDEVGSLTHGTRYTRLDANGNVIVDGILLPNSSTEDPQIGIDSRGNILIAWRSYYQKYDSSGNPIGSAISLGNTSEWDPLSVKMVVDSNDNANIVWMEERVQRPINPDAHIKYAKITGNGNLIVNNLQLDGAVNQSYNPAISIDRNDNLFISWDSMVNGSSKLYLSKISSNGSFVIDKMLVSSSIHSSNLIIDFLGNINIFGKDHWFTQLDSVGNIVVTPRIIGVGDYFSPKVALDRRGAMHLVWYNGPYNSASINYRKSLNPATLRIVGIARPGSQIQFIVNDIYNVNGNYTFGFSGGTYPELNLSDGRRVPLKDDPFLRASLYSPMAIGLINSVGRLNQNSSAVITFNIPNVPLNGTRLYAGFVTHDSTGKIVSISDPVSFVIN